MTGLAQIGGLRMGRIFTCWTAGTIMTTAGSTSGTGWDAGVIEDYGQPVSGAGMAGITGSVCWDMSGVFAASDCIVVTVGAGI